MAIAKPSILIVGRGPSIHDFDWHPAYFDDPQHHQVMAVSSGIFALPEGVKAAHFITLDAPKFYMEPIHDDGEDGIAWMRDDQSRHWPFWLDTTIIKHTTKHRLEPMKYKTIPPEVVDILPDRVVRAFCKELMKSQHSLGFQPTWAQYPPTRAWPMMKETGVNFGKDGPLGLGGVCNSLMLSVQIAHRLGYEHLMFAGIDLIGDHYAAHREIMQTWHNIATTEYGFEWTNLCEKSALAEFMPTIERVAA